MVTIATYNEPAKAKSLKEKLIAAGVKADVNNEANLQTFAFMSKPQANVKVKVEEQDFERAQALLVKWEAADPEIGAMHCPQCDSPRIEYPQLTIFPKEFYCQNCQFTWTNEDDQVKHRLWDRFVSGGPAPER